ncbi:PASTA domain-containing protein [Desulfococcaceae bacterium HSG8]|nr:PASTA domain-containing protein [Desulfococcaceae bacterium HSG8]
MIRRIAKVFFLLGLFALSAGISAWQTLTFIIKSEDTVIIPDLVGKEMLYAAELLTDMGLNTEVEGYEYSPGIPKNHVISQEPEPGAEIKKGRDVRIIVSKGVSTVRMPNLKGISIRQTHIILEEKGLCIGTESVANSETVKKDDVISQSLRPGANAEQGECVNLVVSAGARPKSYIMPDLKGMLLDEALTMIEEMNLEPGEIKSVFHIGAPRNIIAGQEPRAGYPVAERRSVTLVVNRMPGSRRNLHGNKGDRLFRHRVENGFSERHVRVQIKTTGFSQDIFDDFADPGEEIWLLVPKNDQVEILVYEDDKLVSIE